MFPYQAFLMSHNAVNVAVVRKPKHLKVVGIGAAVIAALVVTVGLAARRYQHQELVQWTDAQLIPSVRLAPSMDPATAHAITLPGHLEAWNSAPIHARVGGYLKAWYKDIGAQVKAGDVLAVIDTPELDQQLEQAKAVLVKAQANAHLADMTAQRWQHLLGSDSVSKQEADEKNGDAEAARANVLAAKADVDRLDALETFKKIVAPFDGVVTARHTDVGDLITANNESGPELFTVADTSRMRLYVPVPQADVGSIKSGMKATLTVPEWPGQSFNATLIGNSEAINPSSGSLLAQFVADNKRGELKPGDYSDVQLDIAVDPHRITVPATALIFRSQGPQVAVMGADGRVHLRKVHVALDLGTSLQIDQGLGPNDQVIENPPDSLMDGDQVRVESDNAGNMAAEDGRVSAR
ncbi:RND transporter MFP subunit [Dyella acidisoli]|uniref:RND transporter MFP subunit n=2 Tax=Dyella acidisoli TaxID=1867834 RepID=A0ABQ5XMQ4_9GAMM|nr:RND transporter MFP subunit [Dyella acidisoli]